MARTATTLYIWEECLEDHQRQRLTAAGRSHSVSERDCSRPRRDADRLSEWSDWSDFATANDSLSYRADFRPVPTSTNDAQNGVVQHRIPTLHRHEGIDSVASASEPRAPPAMQSLSMRHQTNHVKDTVPSMMHPYLRCASPGDGDQDGIPCKKWSMVLRNKSRYRSDPAKKLFPSAQKSEESRNYDRVLDAQTVSSPQSQSSEGLIEAAVSENNSVFAWAAAYPISKPDICLTATEVVEARNNVLAGAVVYPSATLLGFRGRRKSWMRLGAHLNVQGDGGIWGRGF
ncbi:hypothetical protein HKX48_004815 [Thoreauomyces humboldtii]|nr:hypothetical protein HKX48_004815 [Thoreauomyces humboldtii]